MPLAPVVRQMIAHFPVLRGAEKGREHDHAAGRLAGPRVVLGIVMQHRRDRLARRHGALEHLLRRRAFAPVVEVDRFAEQRLLAAECRIEAWPLDAHGIGQVAQGRAFVATLPEHLHGLVQGLVAVEAARPPTLQTGFRHFHTSQ